MSEAPLPPDNPVTLREIVVEARDELLQWDRGFPGTARWMLVDPKQVIRSYLWQRSNRFTKPLRYLLVCVAIGLLMDWLIHQKLALNSILAPDTQLDNFLLQHTAVLQLLLLPLMALVLRLMFHGLRLRYVDALIALCYTQAQINLIGAGIIPLVALLPGDRAIVTATSLLMVCYSLWIWSSVAVGDAWRRWLAAILSLLLSQLLNSGFVWLLHRLMSTNS